MEEKCVLCPMMFKQKDELQTHMKVTHPTVHQCEICGKEFKRRSYLIIHERTHSGEKPYSCKDCGKSYTRSSHLKIHHGRVHSTVRPFKCDICSKEFAYKTDLNQHAMSHTGIKRPKPFECTRCAKRLSSRRALVDHEKLHLRENKFHCQYCHQSFIHKILMVKHQKESLICWNPE